MRLTMYEILTVYHGETEIIKNPQVKVGRPNFDFGPGFYVTDIYVQAKDWAEKIADIREAIPILNIYQFSR